MTRSRWFVVVVALLVTAGVALGVALGAAVDGPDATPDATPGAPPGAGPGGSTYRHYVAMGDSFTAGPFIATTDLANGCLRSDHNYPSLVAARLGVDDFTDVSCSGARTEDLGSPQVTYRSATVPAQMEALRPDTDLVTLGIGGNDFGLFTRLAEGCLRSRALDPLGAPCTRQLAGTNLDAQIQRIGRQVRTAVTAIRDRAPRARIVLVGYLRLAPTDGTTCPERLPLAAGDYPLADAITRSLGATLRRAAAEADADFVDSYALSRGHDICAARPWVNGQVTDRGAALAFHPLVAGMRAVARRIVARLT